MRLLLIQSPKMTKIISTILVYFAATYIIKYILKKFKLKSAFIEYKDSLQSLIKDTGSATDMQYKLDNLTKSGLLLICILVMYSIPYIFFSYWLLTNWFFPFWLSLGIGSSIYIFPLLSSSHE